MKNSRNRTGRRQSRGRFRDRSRSRSSKRKFDAPKKKKHLSDHIYNVGSSKNASDCVTNTNFIINHVQKTYDEGLDIATAMRKAVDFDFSSVQPVYQVSSVDPTQDQEKCDQETAQFDKQFDIEFKAFTARRETYRKNKGSAAALLWSQCSSGMKAKLQARDDFDDIEHDPVKLLVAIKEHSMNYEATECAMKTVMESIKNFVNLKQYPNEHLNDYLLILNNLQISR